MDQKMIYILDIIIKQKQIPRTKFINQIINERIQCNKEQVKEKLKEKLMEYNKLTG